MKYKIDPQDHPIYLQIYRQLREDIINGSYGYGTRLPSKRLLSDELNISTVTVEHAYALLCDEGYAEARERSGYFVLFKKSDGFASSSETRSKPNMFVPSHSEQSLPEFPFSVLSKTMRRILTEYGEGLLESSPNTGRLELRNALKRYLFRNRGINVDVEQIVIGSGSEYLYGLIIGLLGRDNVYAIEAPSYKKIEQVYRSTGATYLFLPMTPDGIDSEALAKTEANILHTTPYRSFPTGFTASASKRHEYVCWSYVKGRYIIEDDFESEFSISTKTEDTLFELSERENVIYMNTFSKTVSPSLRIGYMVLPRSLIEQFHSRLGFYSCTVPTFEQLVLAELINSGDFERHINRVRRAKRKLSE